MPPGFTLFPVQPILIFDLTHISHWSIIPLLTRISHEFSQRDRGGAALTRLATEVPAFVLMQHVEEADGAKLSEYPPKL
jgi:hypothetical protein